MNGNGPRKRPPPAQQRDTIKPWLDGKQPTLKIADVYYVISTKWLKQWKAYVSFDEETTTPAAADEVGRDAAAEGAGEQPRKPPNSIDNSVLLKDPGFKSKGNEPVMKTKAIEGVDFILIPQKPWAYLYKWYATSIISIYILSFYVLYYFYYFCVPWFYYSILFIEIGF